MSDAAHRSRFLSEPAEAASKVEQFLIVAHHTATAEVAKVQQISGLVGTVRRAWVFQSVRQTWLASGISHWESPCITGQKLRALI